MDPQSPGSQGGDIAALLDHLSIRSAHLVGVAAGAWAALDFALMAPDRVLTISSVCSLLAMREPDMAEALAGIHPDWFQSLPAEAKELSAGFRLRCLDGVDWWRSVMRANPVPTGPRVSQPLSAPLTWDRLAQLSVPHLMCAGAADLYLPPELAECIAARMPGTSLHVFGKAAHAPFIETPEDFNAILLDQFRGKPLRLATD